MVGRPSPYMPKVTEGHGSSRSGTICSEILAKLRDFNVRCDQMVIVIETFGYPSTARLRVGQPFMFSSSPSGHPEVIA